MSNERDELPDGWEWNKLGVIADVLDGRRVPVNSNERDKRQGRVPYYGATGQVGWIDDYLFDEELLLLGVRVQDIAKLFQCQAYLVQGPRHR